MSERDAGGPGPIDVPREVLISSVVVDDLDTMDAPHVVHVIDPYLDVPLVFGPFPTPGSAAEFADRFGAELRYEGCEEPLRVTVAPLRPG